MTMTFLHSTEIEMYLSVCLVSGQLEYTTLSQEGRRLSHMKYMENMRPTGLEEVRTRFKSMLGMGGWQCSVLFSGYDWLFVVHSMPVPLHLITTPLCWSQSQHI